MRVFCSEHKRGFFAPRQSPIKCENKGHILGKLDFDGDAKTPVELRWQYCCNCSHLCALDVERGGLERCPACSRPSSMLYLCDRCYTLSFESNTPVQTKNFTLTSEGAPQPSCPGCLHATSADLREHTCDALGASLITALNSCPICRERLDVGPSFPSSVADYLKRTKAANKVNVTFDYESELFVPVDDGEFVLVSNGNPAMQPIVLPRTARFATSRDFYDLYQDYYHCAKPAAGQVHIIEPAPVAPTTDGWKLEAPGILEVLEDPSKKKASADGAGQQVNTSAREEPGVSIAAMKELPVAPGILGVREVQPKKKASADGAGHEVNTSAREEPGPSIAAMKEPAAPGMVEVLEDQPKKKASAQGAGQQVNTSAREEPGPFNRSHQGAARARDSRRYWKIRRRKRLRPIERCQEVNTSAREEPGPSIAAMKDSPVAPGMLEVREVQPKKKASADGAEQQAKTSAREEPGPSIAAREESPAAPCPHCGSLIETRYAFCWKCGNQLTRKNESSITRSIKAMPLVEIATDEEEVTVQHDVGRADAAIFSWASTKEPVWTESTKGSVLKLIAVAAVVLALVSLGLFVLTRSAFRTTTVTEAQPVQPNMQFDPNPALGRDQKANVAEEATPQPISTARSEDDSLKTLLESRTGAKASDLPVILQAFARAEKQYPSDYRFPYERAKLAIIGTKSSSHDEAFTALALAAQKAIKAGKAHEMLEGLEADADGDFHRLSHGHHQWKELLEVLRNKDTRLLSARLRL